MKQILTIIAAVSVCLMLCGFTTVDTLKQEQDTAHEAAELIRKLGYEETHVLITALQARWWENEYEIQEIISRRTYTDEEAAMLAKLVAVEAGGLDCTEQSAVIWCVLNRVDNWGGTIKEAVTAPNQFAYYSGIKAEDSLLWLARDVLDRWEAERAGAENVGRTLPWEYMWFWGDGYHNYFRSAYRGGNTWDWANKSPYVG